MPRYRIVQRFPCYNGCIPIDGYFVQVLKEGVFFDKWVDVKGFASKEKAEQLLRTLSL